MAKKEIRRIVSAVAAVCEEKKAEHIRILELDPADSGFTDYFVICSGTNQRQNQAIASGIEDTLKRDFNTLANSVEGYRQGEWILLDYVDFVVHIFSEEKRDFYDIERLRKTANLMDLQELRASLIEKAPAAAKKKPAVKRPAVKKAATRKSAGKKFSGKKTIAAKKSAVKSLKKKAVKKTKRRSA